MISEKGVQKKINVETQFLIKDPEGLWQVISYAWRPDQTDADLVPYIVYPNGQQPFPLVLPIEENGIVFAQNWSPQPTLYCQECHLPEYKPLGFITQQLWSAADDVPGSNQMDLLIDKKVLDSAPDSADFETKDLILKWAELNDSSYSVKHRAASYLAVNCGSCHFPGSRHLVPQHFDYLDSSNINTLLKEGNEGNFYIVPGRPDSSHILKRMIAGEMPLGYSVPRDFDAIFFLWEWMNQLGGADMPRPELSLADYLEPISGIYSPENQASRFYVYDRQIICSTAAVEISLFDLTGKEIKLHRMNNHTYLIPGDLSSGFYLIKSGSINQLHIHGN